MKNKIIIFTLLLVSLSSLPGCQDRLRDEFQNPEQHAPRPDEIIPGMMTQMLYTRFFMQDYGEWFYTFPDLGFLVQLTPYDSRYEAYFATFDIMDGSNGWIMRDNESTKRFNWFYTDLKNWGLMRDEIATLEGAELADNEPFFLVATVMKDAIALQTVDNFNRIPYKDGFGGTLGIFFPKYDDAKETYTTILNELSAMTTRIPEAYAKMSDNAKAAFTKNDLAFKGDPEKWVEYCNALILRHAVRMSGVDEAFAKPLIADAVKNLPSEDFIFDSPKKNPMPLGGDGGATTIARAIYDRQGNMLVTNVLMSRMNLNGIEYVEGEDDPRLPVIAHPTRYTESDQTLRYVGFSMDYTTGNKYWTQTAVPPGRPSRSVVDFGEGITLRTVTGISDVGGYLYGGYSKYNIGTFAFGNIPCYLTSLAEIDLLLAEVAAKGYATTGKSAADHVRDAVVHSTEMWYNINNGGGGLTGTNIWNTQNFPAKRDLLAKAYNPTRPSSTVVGQFADYVKGQMTAAGSDIEAQMEVIMQQKYVHLNILNIYELWAELRRTRHPKLEMLVAEGRNDIAAMMERLPYPSSELSNNEQNYYTVQDEDNFTSPIFWLPDAKKSEKYYMPAGTMFPTPGFKPLPDPNPNRFPSTIKDGGGNDIANPAVITTVVPTIN